jgi:DNA-binding transcriptional LysR family regulator
MHFNFIDMRLLLHIAECNSFTQGAKRSHMSLPAASTRIKHLEESIGALLLLRSSHGVVLTPAGRTYANHARLVQQQVEHLRSDLQHYAEGVKGHVRVFANTTAITEFLPGVLRTYLAQHPSVSIDMREHLSTDILRAVAEGRADIGVTCGNARAEGLEIMRYRKDSLVLAVPVSHPLAGLDEVDFVETGKHEHVGLDEGSAIHTFLTQKATELHLSVWPRVKLRNFEAMCRMVEAGVGIGVLPESSARRYEKTMAIRILRLRDEWASRQLQICVRKNDPLPAFAQELVALLQVDGEASCSEDAHEAPCRMPAESLSAK